jgi:menaquinone-specific isochorismate synthase
VSRGEGLVGWGEALRIRTTGADRFAEAEAEWRRVVATADVQDEVRARGTGLVAFGSFAFADDSPAGGTLVVPATVVGRQGDRAWLTTVEAVGAGPAPGPGAGDVEAWRTPTGVSVTEGALSGDAWRDAVAATVGRISAGEVDKVVLARDLVARSPAPLDERVLLSRLADRYPSTWTFAVDGLVGATPELLARTEGGLVASRVLAGTIRRSGDDAADLALAASLARSGKDLAEHLYAVRSVVEALRPLCSGMNVPDSPYVLHLANVMHLATDVAGVLRGSATSLGIAAALHPSAAVCGTPTKVAAQVIAETEGMDRGRYAGPVGWLDATGDGEWGIALRCGQLSPDRREVRLLAGCGIVDGSDPDAELAESAAKLVPMREALGG